MIQGCSTKVEGMALDTKDFRFDVVFLFEVWSLDRANGSINKVYMTILRAMNPDPVHYIPIERDLKELSCKGRKSCIWISNR